MLIRVKAFPGSHKQEWVKKAEDSFEIKVKAPPVRGLANKEIIMQDAKFKAEEAGLLV